ncbi:MAG: menaquinone biosynthesis decarboxylase [Bacteroidales bacterium]|nr:menaquinone biosynthesis decarboxylase [Bacteroidales bacterium]
MAYKSLTDFINRLESSGELIRIKDFVSPHLEITEIADRMVKNGGKALLFENTGTSFPLLINAFASDRRMSMALGTDCLGDIPLRIGRAFAEVTGSRDTFLEKLKILPILKEFSSWMPKTVRGRGACQDMVMGKADLSKLPVLTCWPADGGPFITLPCVHTRDPETGHRNLGMYRMQVFDPALTGMHWHLHKGSARHYDKYKKIGKGMPVTVTLGGDPVYTYVATAPLPENLDEYLLAGFLRRKQVRMVRCLTNDLEVPSDVDFVIEGYIDPSEDLIFEGPFGDHTGFYSLPGHFPRFHVTCITHRRDAVYPATIVGIPPQEDGWIGKATETIFRLPIKLTVAPEIENMHMPVEGVFHNITFLSIDKKYPGQGSKVMSSLWGAGQMMFNKVMAVFDKGVDLQDYMQLARIISDRVDPILDIHFLRGPSDILDHSSSAYAYGSKMGIDATGRFEGEKEGRADVLEPDVKKDLICQKWPEINALNTDLITNGISLIIISIKKVKKHHVREIAFDILQNEWIHGIKFMVFTDEEVDISRLSMVAWLVANNIDPMRDCFFPDSGPGIHFPVLCLDGTRKTSELDNFEREWPNVIVMDDAIIERIDSRWDSLDLGPFIPSPSLSFKSLVNKEGAFS